jgi:hypothetical protein
VLHGLAHPAYLDAALTRAVELGQGHDDRAHLVVRRDAQLGQARDRVAVGRGGRRSSSSSRMLDAPPGFAHHVLPAAGLGDARLPIPRPITFDQQPLGQGGASASPEWPDGVPPSGRGQLKAAGRAETMTAGRRAPCAPPSARPSGLTDPSARRSGPAGDRGALLLQFEDGPQVHLRGVDQLRHAPIFSARAAWSPMARPGRPTIPAGTMGWPPTGDPPWTRPTPRPDPCAINPPGTPALAAAKTLEREQSSVWAKTCRAFGPWFSLQSRRADVA